jgi:hypothetical protein
MSFNEIETKRIEKEIKAFIEKRRPPIEIRNQVDLDFKIEKYSVIIHEIRAIWNKPDEKVNVPIGKATYIKTNNTWKIFWQRADLKWHKYDPNSEVKTLAEFIEVVDKDEYGCFWG